MKRFTNEALVFIPNSTRNNKSSYGLTIGAQLFLHFNSAASATPSRGEFPRRHVHPAWHSPSPYSSHTLLCGLLHGPRRSPVGKAAEGRTPTRASGWPLGRNTDKRACEGKISALNSTSSRIVKTAANLLTRLQPLWPAPGPSRSTHPAQS